MVSKQYSPTLQYELPFTPSPKQSFAEFLAYIKFEVIFASNTESYRSTHPSEGWKQFRDAGIIALQLCELDSIQTFAPVELNSEQQ